MKGYYSIFDYNNFLRRECEFNYLVLDNINLMCEIDESKENLESYLWTMDHNKFDVIFNQFTNLISSQDKSLVKDFIKTKKLKKIPSEDLVKNRDKYGAYKNIYEYMFFRLSFFLEKGNFKFITPRESDYIRVRKELQNIKKPIITINGRNLGESKNIHRNRSLYKHIDLLIRLGAFVINLTDYRNNYDFDKTVYREIGSIGMDYSETISYFLNSNCLISIGSSGGISNHMLTPTNLLILNDEESWVDNNNRVNYPRLSMVEARRNYLDFKTINTNYGYLNAGETNIDNSLLELAINLEKPMIKDFYNPNIIHL